MYARDWLQLIQYSMDVYIYIYMMYSYILFCILQGCGHLLDHLQTQQEWRHPCRVWCIHVAGVLHLPGLSGDQRWYVLYHHKSPETDSLFIRLFLLTSEKTLNRRITGVCHQLLVDAPHKDPAMQEAFPCQDAIMISITNRHISQIHLPLSLNLYANVYLSNCNAVVQWFHIGCILHLPHRFWSPRDGKLNHNEEIDCILMDLKVHSWFR